MKIKITEDQAKRFKLLTENADPLTQFEQLCKVKVLEVNKWYGKITAISIIEIINNEVNMTRINDALNKIEHDLRIANRHAYGYINGLPEEDLDVRIDRADDLVMNKLTPLQLITMDLEKLQLSIEEHGIANSFGDIKPVDITDIQ